MAIKSMAELVRRVAESARKVLDELSTQIKQRHAPSYEHAYARRRGRLGNKPLNWGARRFHTKRHPGCPFNGMFHSRVRRTIHTLRIFACGGPLFRRAMYPSFYSNRVFAQFSARSLAVQAHQPPPPVWAASLVGWRQASPAPLPLGMRPVLWRPMAAHFEPVNVLERLYKASGTRAMHTRAVSAAELGREIGMAFRYPRPSMVQERPLAEWPSDATAHTGEYSTYIPIPSGVFAGRADFGDAEIAAIGAADMETESVLSAASHTSQSSGWELPPQLVAAEPITAAVDFDVPRAIFPPVGELTDDGARALVDSLNAQIAHLQAVSEDIQRVAALGELPVSLERDGQTVRVHFPNSDSERVELLLRDQEVSFGRVVELPRVGAELPPAALEWPGDVTPELSMSVSTVSDSFSLI